MPDNIRSAGRDPGRFGEIPGRGKIPGRDSVVLEQSPQTGGGSLHLEWVLGFRISGRVNVGSRVRGVEDLWFVVESFGFRVWRVGFRIWG